MLSDLSLFPCAAYAQDESALPAASVSASVPATIYNTHQPNWCDAVADMSLYDKIQWTGVGVMGFILVTLLILWVLAHRAKKTCPPCQQTCAPQNTLPSNPTTV